MYDEAMALGKAYRESLRPSDHEEAHPTGSATG
jgi:hypothetical protein